jgi:methionyl-tRNA formyltransferase
LSIYKQPVNKPLQISTAHYDTHSNSLLIRCADDTILSVTQVKQQDRNALYAKEWWNGVRPELRQRDEQGKLAGLLLGFDEDGNPSGNIKSA